MLASRKKSRTRKPSLFNLHRYAGVFSVVFVLMLSSTGILLNHTETFKLDERYVNSPGLLSWYGIKTPSSPQSYQVGDHWISLFGHQLYFNKKIILNDINKLVGAISDNVGIVYIATPNQLILLSEEGEIIEQLSKVHGLPENIHQIGMDNQSNLAISADKGVMVADHDLIIWSATKNIEAIHWSNSSKLPQLLHNALLLSHQGQGLTFERIILDFHSGRILGSWGIYLIDLVALIFIFLALAGVWLWLRRI